MGRNGEDPETEDNEGHEADGESRKDAAAGGEPGGADLSAPGSRWLTPIGSRRIRSRLEELAPGESVGEHVTHHREEVVLFLEGRAKVTLEGTEHIVDAPWGLYIGPQVTHDIANAGDGVLRYVYVVALHHDPVEGGGKGHDHGGE